MAKCRYCNKQALRAPHGMCKACYASGGPMALWSIPAFSGLMGTVWDKMSGKRKVDK